MLDIGTTFDCTDGEVVKVVATSLSTPLSDGVQIPHRTTLLVVNKLFSEPEWSMCPFHVCL